MAPPSSLHSRTAPGPTPRRRRTVAGTDTWPCAVSFEWAIGGIDINYHGNVPRSTPESGDAGRSAADLGDDPGDEQIGQQHGHAGQPAQLVARLATEAHAVHHHEPSPAGAHRVGRAAQRGRILLFI